MKYFLITFLLPTFLFAQSSNWNSVVDLNFSVNSSDRIDLYTDVHGNHILVGNGSTLIYYLYYYSGSQIRNDTIDNSITTTFSKVTGLEGTIYVSYKEGSTIYTKKSTNAGQNWSSFDNISMDDSDSDGMEIWADDNGLHLVYSVWDDNNDVYESIYQLYDFVDARWENEKTVTDETNVDGGQPTITTSANRVHIGYTIPNDSGVKSRDKYNTTWQSSQEVSHFYPLRISLIATSTKLHALYSEIHLPNEYLYYKNRDIAGTTWSDSIEIDHSGCWSEEGKPDMVVSANGSMHMVADDLGDLDYREWDDTLSSPYKTMDIWDAPRISASGNDIFVIGITEDGSGGYEIKMRQRDAIPLTPTISKVAAINYGDYPKITWKRPCLDVKEYDIYRKVNGGSYTNIATTSNLYYEDDDYYFDPYSGWDYLYYKIKAVDNDDNESDFSNVKEYDSMELNKIPGNKEFTPSEYALKNAYPNPFNPTTTLRFDLPEDSFVDLAVYNVMGQKVASLVNGSMPTGRHQVKFDGNGLSSGVYFIKMIANNFSAMQKILLTK